jgi:VWFA-related protein
MAQRLVAIGLSLAAVVVVHGQQPFDSAHAKPIFRARVDLVTVDATVVGPDGRAADHLDAGDFALKVDGETRRIVSAQYVAFGRPESTATLRDVQHFTSNEVDEGRLIVIAVDQAHIRQLEGRAALRAAAGFLDLLDPRDRVAVTSLNRTTDIVFTREHRALKARLERFIGQGDPVFLNFNLGLLEATEIADGSRTRLADAVQRECGRSLTEYINVARAADDAGGRDACPEQLEQEARALSQHARTQARISLSSLEGLIAGLRDVEGPKAVILLSEGMVIDPRLVDLSDVAAKAHEARVSIHALHLDVPLFEAAQDRVSPTALRDVELRGDGLARLAGASRGAVYRLVGSDPGPFRRIATDLGGYYLLAFEAGDRDRDGKAHRISVDVTSRGHVVRARSAFRMPREPATPLSREDELVALLRRTQPAVELPVRVATSTYPEPESGRLRVVVSMEADSAPGASEVLMGYVLIDANGVIAASGAHAVDGRHAFSAVVPEGRYTLRVAGIDALRRKGLVERPFVAATIAAGALRVSSLILAPAGAANGALQPIVHRTSEQSMTAYVEVFAAEGVAPSAVQVRFEVLNDHAASPLVARTASGVRADGGLTVARTDLSLAGLPPGAYQARAVVVADGQPVGEVVRPFSFAPR